LRQKGVYPYSSMDDYNKFNHTQLRPIDACYNDLENTPRSEADYNHAINERNQLDSQFITAPSLTYWAGLKYTSAKLEALTDIDMYERFYASM
jgi:hypothetical protein